MEWFYNSIIFKAEKTKFKNNIGQQIESYTTSSPAIKCDVQPASVDLVKKTFGEDINCNFIVYCDDELQTDDIVVYKNKPFKVEKTLPWDYTIAAIKGVDLVVK